MKVVILAGGLGTRLSEETELKPKPMVEIGGRPILWHIMRHYRHFELNEFFIALGYRGEIIKRYFWDLFQLNGNMSFDFGQHLMEKRDSEVENWIVNLHETGLETMTGGRLKRLETWLKNETFMMTYGDGVSNIDLRNLLAFHREQGKIATISAVHPPSRFGEIVFQGNSVAEFNEKPQMGDGWINGGFMVLEPEIFSFIDNDQTIFETEVLECLAKQGQLAALRHYGFWQSMDTLRDKRYLEKLWSEGSNPWII